MRNRDGNRRHIATFQQHDGTVDSHGHPTLGTSADWDDFISGWPCELLTGSGGERLRGRQVTAETTHVLFGEYFGAEGVTAKMRVLIDDPTGTSVTYQVVSAYDPDGDGREMRVELRRET